MKRAGRWALALMAAGALMLGGCSGDGGGTAASGPPTAEEVAAIFAGDFSAEAAVTVGISEETDDSLDLTALVTKSDGSCLVEVTAPEHLEGLTFCGRQPGGGGFDRPVQRPGDPAGFDAGLQPRRGCWRGRWRPFPARSS